MKRRIALGMALAAAAACAHAIEAYRLEGGEKIVLDGRLDEPGATFARSRDPNAALKHL